MPIGSGDERYEDALGRAATTVVGAFDLSGEWVSETGSTLDVIEEAGVVTGVFTCRIAEASEPMVGQVSGCVQGGIVGLVVKWDAMAVASWVGHHWSEAGEEIIEACWQMTLADGPGERQPLPTYAGTDRFTRGAVPVGAPHPAEREAGDAVEPEPA